MTRISRVTKRSKVGLRPAIAEAKDMTIERSRDRK